MFALLATVATLAVTTALGSGAASAAPALPTHLLTGYWQNFVNGAKPLKLADVPQSYGIVAVSFADAVPSRSGAIDFTLDPGLSSALGGYTDAQFKADVATLKGRGQKVIISVGGQNGAISLPDAASATAFADTTYSLMQEYGFDGVDIDLENAPNLANMTTALKSLAGKAGSGFVLTMAPETIYVQPGGSYLQLIDQVKDLITVVNTQYYNSGSMIGQDGKVYSSGTVDFETALADILLNGHLRADQVGLGLPASTSAAGSGYVAPSVVDNALDCLTMGTNCGSYKPTAKYPTLRGAMTWSINWDASNGYTWANTVGGHLGSLPGGGGTTTPPTTSPTTPTPTATTTTTPPTSTTSTSTPPSTGCTGLAAWSATTAYNGGQRVSYTGHAWTAKWWTYGDKPGANAQDVWVDGGAC
jgi:chitinase